MIHFENVGLRYGMGPEVLRDLTFDIPKESFQFLTGPSGAGKTTLMRLLFMSLQPTRGLVRTFGRDISTIGREELPLLFLEYLYATCFTQLYRLKTKTCGVLYQNGPQAYPPKKK